MIKKIKSSLFAKVFLITAILLSCMSLLVFGLLAWLMPQTYSNRLNEIMDSRTQEFISELEQVTYSNSGGLFDQFIQNTGINHVELYDENALPVALPTERFNSTEGMIIMQTAVDDDDNLKESSPIQSNSYYFSFLDSSDRYMLIVFGTAEQVSELQQSFLRILPLLFGIVLVVAFTVSWLYSRIITKPVLEISRISEKMSDLHLQWQIKEPRADELGVLEKSLNRLSHNLSAALSDLQNANKKLEADIEHEKALEQAQLDFFSAASHELKTPITVIKGQLEGMLLGIGAYKDHKKYLSRSLEIANTLETMVQELLTVSRLQTPNADYKSDYFDCVPIIQSYLRETEDLIVSRELQINLDLPATVLVNGNRLLIEKVFSNLIGNAIKYSPQGANIDISVHEQQAKYLFFIENSGTHIPEEAIEKIFDAFYRVDQSRSRKTGGSGLGLYIVQKVLQQHNSYCSVCNTKTGVQFSFELS